MTDKNDLKNNWAQLVLPFEEDPNLYTIPIATVSKCKNFEEVKEALENGYSPMLVITEEPLKIGPSRLVRRVEDQQSLFRDEDE